MTKWKIVKSILKGKDKGSNLIVLGIFLITLGASYKVVEPIAMCSLHIVGNLLTLLGIMAFFIGFLNYVFEKDSD